MATLDGSWVVEGDTISFKGGTVFLNGRAVGSYHGTAAHMRVDHGAEQPQPTVCDASLADENSAVFSCSGGSVRTAIAQASILAFRAAVSSPAA